MSNDEKISCILSELETLPDEKYNLVYLIIRELLRIRRVYVGDYYQDRYRVDVGGWFGH